MIRPSILSWRLAVHPVVLFYLLASLLAPVPVEARECFWYTDSLGRRRRRCRGLVPGIIAALVVGLFVILAFLSLAFVLRRRQQRATLESGAVFTQPGTNNLMSQQQPPAYPPPSYPAPPPANPPPAAYYKLEKNEAGAQDPIQPPPPANLAIHHAGH
ncbi:hypothetical protein PGT21_003866 [Puccinia graminis f. sp. tritici]|uniref:Uncharacterized protein n=1 Tax=Puccinia graminis f. sp. tritici TaxID=56615 RepID=A0A5B0NZX8_PUCGR|nr:hypothetical protein PGTUg99_016696 [Puccinia graminis f. sp. tritici]KAA1094811.1 hypothetical protein PGT21_030759 [Puccinia graminis f. sp. tritici]KAA1118729.1 hypothetical protein PGT21_003866 [Puccinia graminis f. sp. tritici]